MNKQHVFLSYSHEDLWEMRAIYNELRLAGFRVWIDDQLTPGTHDWQQAIKSMLDVAACVVCICSPNAKKSQWVNTEIQISKQRELRIYPVLISKVHENVTDAIPDSIKLIQFTDCRNEYTTSIKKLIDELIENYKAALMFDTRSLFIKNGIKWTSFGSLFWFSSEVRKIRLFLSPESPTIERVRDSLVQLRHHAERLNVGKFTLRDINHVEDEINKLSQADFVQLSSYSRNTLESKLRSAQDNVAKEAEKIDLSFADGPRPGKPIVLVEQEKKQKS